LAMAMVFADDGVVLRASKSAAEPNRLKVIVPPPLLSESIALATEPEVPELDDEPPPVPDLLDVVPPPHAATSKVIAATAPATTRRCIRASRGENRYVDLGTFARRVLAFRRGRLAIADPARDQGEWT
jgi:hypothetical protein